MSNFDHKNIVKFKEALRDIKGDLYIIMDCFDESLEHKIKNDIQNKGGPLEES